MSRIGITRDDVYNAAQMIAESGAFPTIQSVRSKIGSGSLVTINKHLQVWKSERLLKPAIKIEPGHDALKPKKIVAENLELQAIVEKQMEQNSALSAKILKLEQEKMEVKSSINVLALDFKNVTDKNLDLKKVVSEHNNLLTELKVAHLTAMNTIIDDKNSAIEGLKEELKAVHAESLTMVRQMSFDGQDLLMTERVKNINLTEQLKVLQDRIAKLEKNTLQDYELQTAKAKKIKSYTLEEIYEQNTQRLKASEEDL
jgi:hypothetical protein